ncbi:YheC/YheD family protein [Hazenella sp. IB182353]|uniref:YheC/YheD family protein n=1 Tax=Polycladospora coralii TaxID=2771432 RepID=UPI0017471ECB|nr:YheC/YheD family protein [Polycladospora coralii]MBS7530517.1 YheC/YheD family protein [Polycladospora coralii]
MKPVPLKEVASKAYKTMILTKNKDLIPYIPETRWYSITNLKLMLDRYPAVFIKPDKGGGGGGAIRVKEFTDGNYECKSVYERKNCNEEQMEQWVASKLYREKIYIIQKGINLAQLKKRPYDIRVHLNKIKGNWTIVGMCAKLGLPGKIVTNHCKGAKPIFLHQALSEVCQSNSFRTKKLTRHMQDLSLVIASTLNHKFTALRDLGIDLAVDTSENIWVLEVNTRPDPTMFRKLPNLEMYQRIIKFKPRRERISHG